VTPEPQADTTTLELLKTVSPILAGLVSGILAAWLTARWKLNEITTQFEFERREREEEAKEKLKMQYLDPLRFSAQALHDRIRDIIERRTKSDTLLCDTIRQIEANNISVLPHDAKYDLWTNDTARVHWANDMGHFALSTLLITASYFYNASKILRELPYVELSAGDDAALRDHLIRVRKAFGGPYGIWDELQDSLGSYIIKENNIVMNYREFCHEIFHKTDALWFSRLISFYGDVHMKNENELDEMVKSLRSLDSFLDQKSRTAR
jgi:hypothetical protein